MAERPETGRPSPGSDREGGLPAGPALAVYVLAVVALTVLGVWLVPMQGPTGASVPPGALISQGAVFLLASLLPAWALLVLSHGRSPGALGFYLHPSAVGEATRGLGIGTAVTLVAVAAMAAAGVVRWVDDAGTLLDLLREGGVALSLLALPAAAEEAFFRGYPLQILSRSWGPGWALLATSVAFGLLHALNPGLGWVALLNLAVAGGFLGVVYLKTGSLWWATGAHLGWNWALGFLVDLPVSGYEMVDTPIWTGVSSGPGWLGGGSFGPEGSVLTTGVVLLATALLWRSPWPSPGPALRSVEPVAVLLPSHERRSGMA